MVKSGLKKQDGFTLAEVMVVLVILGVVASIAIPQFFSVIENSQKKADEASIKIVESALELYRVENGNYPEAETFNSLITELNKVGLIKETEIKSASSKYVFTYDSGEHEITRTASGESSDSTGS